MNSTAKWMTICFSGWLVIMWVSFWLGSATVLFDHERWHGFPAFITAIAVAVSWTAFCVLKDKKK